MYLISRNGYYHIEYFDNQLNKMKRKSTKTRNKSEALKFLSEFKKNIQQVKLVDNNVTLSKFFEEYTQRTEYSVTRDYQRSISLSFKMLMTFSGNVRIASLTSRDAEHFLLSTFSKSKHAAHLYYRTLKAAFNTALEWEYIFKNPFIKIKMPKIPTKLPQFIAVQEFYRIIDLENDDTLRDLYILTYYTGMRLAEVANLKWSDVFSLDYIIISHKSDFVTKSKKERQIPFSSIVKGLIERRYSFRNHSEYVFFNKVGKKLERDYVSKHFKRCVKTYDPKSTFNFHTLRHSFASNLAQKGVSLYIIKTLLGHASISTTEIYAHLNNETLEKAVLLL